MKYFRHICLLLGLSNLHAGNFEIHKPESSSAFFANINNGSNKYVIKRYLEVLDKLNNVKDHNLDGVSHDVCYAAGVSFISEDRPDMSEEEIKLMVLITLLNSDSKNHFTQNLILLSNKQNCNLQEDDLRFYAIGTEFMNQHCPHINAEEAKVLVCAALLKSENQEIFIKNLNELYDIFRQNNYDKWVEKYNIVQVARVMVCFSICHAVYSTYTVILPYFLAI